MPLSNVKLNLSAFAPLIDRTDKYLGGWQSSLLNSMGRTVLVNAVLNSALIYICSAMLLPRGIIDVLDRKRRAFLWSGESTTSGAQCLVAWEKACLPKEQGGLGIKDLRSFNQCLLLKLLHRLHHPEESAWAKWMADQVNLASLRGACAGNHWDSLKELMPVYRAITVTDVGNGVRTSFWLDRWLPAGILMEVFPALYTHSLHKDASVAEVLSSQFRAHFAPRLTRAAAAELATLEEITEDIVLTLCPDNRRCKLAAQDGILRAGPVYRAAQHAQSMGDCAFYKFVWQNHAPPRVRFFAWLLVQEKIQCKTNLLLKNIIEDATCNLCMTEMESPDHLILHCPFAKRFWLQLGFCIPVNASVTQLWQLRKPAALPQAHYSTYLLLCAWQLWKHRHDVVFRGETPSHLRLILSCKAEARLWRCRLPHDDQAITETWCNSFCSNM